MQDGEVEEIQLDAAEEVPPLSWAELMVLYADGVRQFARGSWCQYLQRGGIQDRVAPAAKVVCDVHCVSVARHVNWKTHLSAVNTRVLGSS